MTKSDTRIKRFERLQKSRIPKAIKRFIFDCMTLLAMFLPHPSLRIAANRGRGVKIGTGCWFGMGVMLAEYKPWLIEIENNVILASGVKIITHDTSYTLVRGKHADVTGKVKIGRNTHIGTNAIIFPRITIGENSIIGASALVNRDIPANSIAVGIPAKVVGTTKMAEYK